MKHPMATKKPTTKQLIKEAFIMTAFGLIFIGVLVAAHYISGGGNV